MPKKNNTPAKLAQTIVVDVSTADYHADLTKGLQADEIMQPGSHTFRRGGFLQRHGREESIGQSLPSKVRISINIDSDILDYFKARAAQPNAAAYQTQINNALRTMMEQEQQQPSLSTFPYADELLADQRFIDAVARRVAEQAAVYQTKEK
ncbi:MAG: BrnA antitoxin family protein [Chloroflexi bacterium]|nr:BrnA antitoxin family protein [Chloroflexota bacterium]